MKHISALFTILVEKETFTCVKRASRSTIQFGACSAFDNCFSSSPGELDNTAFAVKKALKAQLLCFNGCPS